MYKSCTLMGVNDVKNPGKIFVQDKVYIIQVVWSNGIFVLVPKRIGDYVKVSTGKCILLMLFYMQKCRMNDFFLFNRIFPWS